MTDKQRMEEDAANAANNQAFMENQRKLKEKLTGDGERDRALFLKTPPVPPQKNGLLGQWWLDKTKKKPANALAELNAMISQPACEMVFGDGICDFRPRALSGIDAGVGETLLDEVDYRGNEGLVGVIPKGGELFVFKIVGFDRVQELTSTRIGADPCDFVRVGAGAQANGSPVGATREANAPSSSAPVAASGRKAAGPPPSSAARPAREVCSRTFLDKLGVAGVDQVRQMADLRFKETVDGKVPNTLNLRIDLRGSACDVRASTQHSTTSTPTACSSP